MGIADLSITKTDSPDPVGTSSTLTYTIGVTNTSATVTATSEVTLVVMHERNFRAMEEEIPLVASRIQTILEERKAKAVAQGIDSVGSPE